MRKPALAGERTGSTSGSPLWRPAVMLRGSPAWNRLALRPRLSRMFRPWRRGHPQWVLSVKLPWRKEDRLAESCGPSEVPQVRRRLKSHHQAKETLEAINELNRVFAANGSA